WLRSGSLSNVPIFSVRIMPSITESIIIQLLSAVVPQMARLHREDGAPQKIIQYPRFMISCLFFFHDTPPTDIYTLSLHDALPISSIRFTGIRRTITGRSQWGIEYRDDEANGSERAARAESGWRHGRTSAGRVSAGHPDRSDTGRDRKSTRLNSSHVSISYAVFCLK